MILFTLRITDRVYNIMETQDPKDFHLQNGGIL